jgi:hypothetical protein
MAKHVIYDGVPMCSGIKHWFPRNTVDSGTPCQCGWTCWGDFTSLSLSICESDTPPARQGFDDLARRRVPGVMAFGGDRRTVHPECLEPFKAAHPTWDFND